MTESEQGNTGAAVVAADLAAIIDQADQAFARMAGDSVLIVGGGGFLGFYLVQSLLAWNDRNRERPIHVTVFDNWIRGCPQWLVDLSGDAYLRVQTVDISRPLPTDAPPYDWIIHAASIASPTYYRQFPIETMDANVNGLRNLLDYGLAWHLEGRPFKGFLFYSTSEIYGDPSPDAIPTPETYRGNVSCTGPRACYDESKRYGETLCVNFSAVHGLPIKIARPFNNYGPGLKITDRRVIADFARDVMAGRDIVMHSKGTPTRTFCYITDAMVGYFKVLTHGRPGESYNIGTETPEISIAELASTIVAMANSQFEYTGSVIHHQSTDPQYLTDNPSRRCPSIIKAREELGYQPQINLVEGLRRTLIWYRDNPIAEES